MYTVTPSVQIQQQLKEVARTASIVTFCRVAGIAPTTFRRAALGQGVAPKGLTKIEDTFQSYALEAFQPSQTQQKRLATLRRNRQRKARVAAAPALAIERLPRTNGRPTELPNFESPASVLEYLNLTVGVVGTAQQLMEQLPEGVEVLLGNGTARELYLRLRKDLAAL